MSAVSDFLDGLFSNLLKNEAAVLQPVADTYLTSIINNPAPDNVVAQSVAYQVQALAALPNVEKAAALTAATALKSFIDAQIPTLIAQATASAASAPATAPASSSTATPAT